VFLVEFAPGAWEAKHTHPGPLIGYILQGTFDLEHEGRATAAYKADQAFYVEPGKIHAAINSSDKPVKFIVTLVVEKVSPLQVQFRSNRSKAASRPLSSQEKPAGVTGREAAQREAAQIWKMIGELDRRVQLLDADIAAEEERIGNLTDLTPAYPILAMSRGVRRDNLMDTIAALKERLPRLDQAEPLAEGMNKKPPR
jgi:hypothetical protein